MNKTEIMNTYAKEQGYESWYDLLKCTVTIYELSQDLNKVTDLIQEEFKKKIHYEYQKNISKYWYDSTKLKDDKVILNTEIL